MKKNIKIILAFVFMMLIPLSVFADEKKYEYFNIKAERVDGGLIRDTKIYIYASLEDDEKNLIDRTEEFNILEVMWSKCVEKTCATTEQVTADSIFEEGSEYVLMLRFNAKNDADIDVWGTEKAQFNGNPIEDLDGEYANTGKELMIKTKTAVEKTATTEDKEETVTGTETIEEETEEETTTEEEETSCFLGMSFCCTEYMGISICNWILIGVCILLLLLLIINSKRKGKKKDKKKKDADGENQLTMTSMSNINMMSAPGMPQPQPQPQPIPNMQQPPVNMNQMPAGMPPQQNMNAMPNMNNNQNPPYQQ